ncbi:dehydrogenase [Arthrobacter sp. Soil782]|uniref:C-terminal binding protein n=1 Tax=Arthrobacter sp. Soil782 TaxID=1736410 RepID=UPI0006FC19FA|nr:C-terminal binding protein [Arthrobacter sp. Soil782]KRF06346.1 dehydrogenase [Arthrobacter sp. Soil782]
MKIVITDCDHAGIEEELAVAHANGVNLELKQCRTEDDVIAVAAGADALIVQYAPISDHVLQSLPSVRAIGRYGVGVDTVDVEAASRRNVAVCNVPDYGTEDVSDHAIALAVSLSRGIVQFDRRTRAGRHELAPVQPLHRFNTRIFAVVGLGLIGAATARKAKGLGFEVVGYDPALEVGSTTEGDVRVIDLDELYGIADIVSLHVPLNKETHHLIDRAALRKFKNGSLLINTCRGGVVDSSAVVEALRSGKLKGAGLDVFENEPMSADDPLAGLDNAVLTPHVAWYSEESYSELKRRTIENVVEYCAGRAPQNILNADALTGEAVR